MNGHEVIKARSRRAAERLARFLERDGLDTVPRYSPRLGWVVDVNARHNHQETVWS